MSKSGDLKSEEEIGQAIKLACSVNLGVLDSNFMCQSVSVLQTRQHPSVKEGDSIEAVLQLLRSTKTGCVLVLNDMGKLSGIFSERDVVLKVSGAFQENLIKPVSDLMTKDPVTVPPDCTIAYALNLMSQGGFRHLPLVADDGTPIGILSVKDVVDYLVGRFVDDIMAIG